MLSATAAYRLVDVKCDPHLGDVADVALIRFPDSDRCNSCRPRYRAPLPADSRSSRFPNGSVSLPSFSNSGNAPSPGHSPADQYGALPGSHVYTVYIDTDAGTAVLQYSSADTSGKEFSQDLVAPEAVRAEVPADLRSAKFVVACVVDRSGLLRNLRVLQNSSPGALGQLLSMLHEWRFRPVLRGNAAIEVNAIVGFNIDTR